MSIIGSVPTGRISDQLISQQLVEQVQSSLSQLSKLQQQISSGNALILPSDNPSVALQGIAINNQLARYTQVSTNLTSAQNSLNSTESALGNIENLLVSVSGTATAAVGSTATAQERQADITTVDQAINELVNLGNQQFDGAYLFSGSKTSTQPFVRTGAGVLYQGDASNISTYSGLTTLITTNVSGDAALGAISPVQGSADLNPVLTNSTPLSDLLGGQGVHLGSVAVSNGTTTSVVDLSGAATIGDVARLLEINPPAGSTITARVTPTGLTVQLAAAGGGSPGNLTIDEVGNGNTAAQLGIRQIGGQGRTTIVGTDLNPQLDLTTPLSNLLGTKAIAYLASPGANNDLVIQAANNGAAYNGATINVINSSHLQAGPAPQGGQATAVYNANATSAVASLALPGSSNDLLLTATTPGTAFNNVSVNIVNGGNLGNAANASYNAATKTLTLSIDGSGQTSTAALITAIDADGTFTAARDSSNETNSAGGTVLASSVGTGLANTYNTASNANSLDVYVQTGVTTANDVVAAINAQGTFQASLDTTESGNNGGGIVPDSAIDPAVTATASGGSGTSLDQTSGFQITNGGKTVTVDTASAKTVSDLLNVINASGAGVTAQINSAGNGITVRSVLSGSTFSIGENGGTTATQLGIRTFTTSTPLSSLNNGQGVSTVPGADFTITRADGVQIPIDISSAQTVGDVINLINNNATNLASGVPVVAQLATTGNGIELIDDDPTAAGTLSVAGTTSTSPATDLGLIPAGATTSGVPTTATAAAVNITSAGANNDLTITSNLTGAAGNGVVVQFQNTGAGPSVNYNAGSKTLTFDVDPTTTTANQLVALLAASPAGLSFTASLASSDAGNNGTGTLGVLPPTSTLAGGTAQTLVGADTNPGQVQGAFTALLQLESALSSNDIVGIQNATSLLNQSMQTVQNAQAEVGVQLQGINDQQTQLTNQTTQLQTASSQDLGVDMTQAISNLLNVQTAYQASLQLAGDLSKYTLFSFLQ